MGKSFIENNSLFITLFILLVFISNKLSKTIPLLASKDQKKFKDSSHYDKYLLSTIIFYFYIFLFGFVLVIVIVNAIISIVFEGDENHVKNFVSFLNDFVLELFPHFISSMVVVIPMHFLIFYLYRYGYIDNRIINFKEEIGSWIMISSFILYFSIVYSYQFFNPAHETFDSDTVMNEITKHITNDKIEKFEEFLEQYDKVKGGDLSSGGGDRGDVVRDYEDKIKQMKMLQRFLKVMLVSKKDVDNNGKISPWNLTKMIGKLMKNAYETSGGDLNKHYKSVKYTLSLFILYMVLSVFKWIPSTTEAKPKDNETQEELREREELEDKKIKKNKLVFIMIKVCLVISVMFS